MISQFKTDLLEFDLVPISANITDAYESSKKKSLHLFISLYQSLIGGQDTQIQIKDLLLSSNGIWGLLDELLDTEVEDVASLLTTIYFSLPKKILAYAKSEADEFFYDRPFADFTVMTLREALKTPMTKSVFLKYSFALDHLDNFGIYHFKSCSGFPEFITNESMRNFSNLPSLAASVLGAIIEIMPVSIDLLSKLKRFIEVTDLEPKRILDYILEKGIWSCTDLIILLHALEPLTIIDAVKCQLEKWANKSFTNSAPLSEQLYFATVLASLLSFSSPESFSSGGLELLLFEGVGLRLDHSDPQVRPIGMTVAEFINSLTLSFSEDAKKLDFELDSRNEIVKYIRDARLQASGTLSQALGYGPELECAISFQCKTIPDQSQVTCFSENEPKNAKVKTPIFLNDCLKVLRVNEDPEMVEKVIDRLPSTYSNSSRLDKQMNALSMFKTLSSLSDKFEISEFDSKRLEMMETVLVEHIPLIAPTMVSDLFGMNQLVLNQKMEFLQVICAATRRIFGTKSLIQPSIQASEHLKHFESSLQSLENPSNSVKSAAKEAELVQHMFIPFVKRSIRSFETFFKSHVMFLDKCLWLLAILLSASRNQLLFSEFVDRYLDLVLMVSKTEMIQQGPIKTATLLGLSVSLENWPKSMRILDNYDRLQRIYDFISAIDADSEQSQLLACVALNLESLCNPQNILKESGEQISLDFNAIKIQ